MIIGDFYGEVEKAVISPDESYCVMVGCGIIVYFLKEPFMPYEYDIKTSQYCEWYREGNVWIEKVEINNDDTILVKTESGRNIEICINS